MIHLIQVLQLLKLNLKIILDSSDIPTKKIKKPKAIKTADEIYFNVLINRFFLKIILKKLN